VRERERERARERESERERAAREEWVVFLLSCPLACSIGTNVALTTSYDMHEWVEERGEEKE
jgi:hypothetical protein